MAARCWTSRAVFFALASLTATFIWKARCSMSDSTRERVAPHGTLAAVADSHEIANVAGIRGIRYLLECARQVPLDLFLMAPSCALGGHSHRRPNPPDRLDGKPRPGDQDGAGIEHRCQITWGKEALTPVQLVEGRFIGQAIRGYQSDGCGKSAGSTPSGKS